MCTLLHHIQPWMQKSIAEEEETIEKNMAWWTERQNMEVIQHLDAFELRVLAWKTPIVDLTTLQDVVASMIQNMDTILEGRVPEFEAPSAEPAEDIVMATLFSTTAAPSTDPREHTKRHQSRKDDETRARNRERLELKAFRRASLIDEEA